VKLQIGQTEYLTQEVPLQKTLIECFTCLQERNFSVALHEAYGRLVYLEVQR